MKKHLAHLAMVALLTHSWANPAWSQCCLGAQNVTGESKNGQFQVEGESLTGTGHHSHGPYHFRFRFLKRAEGGEFEEQHSFKIRWDCNDHFGMEIHVSPTGNGFAIEFPHDRLAFYSPRGQELYRLPERRGVEPSEDGYNLRLLETVSFDRFGLAVEDGQLFLPLGTKVTKSLDYQAIFYLFASPREIKAAQKRVPMLIDKLGHDDVTVGDDAEARILRYGFVAIPTLWKTLESSTDTEVHFRAKRLIEKLAPWNRVTPEDGWRDLELIASFLYYPDFVIQGRAKHQLQRLIEASLEDEDREGLHAWVQGNRDRLQWDAEKLRYHLPPESSSK